MKGVRGFRSGLCLRKVPIFIGPIGGLNVISGAEKREKNIIYGSNKNGHFMQAQEKKYFLVDKINNLISTICYKD